MQSRFESFDAEAFKGNQALVIANGTIKAQKVNNLKATSTLCFAEEIEARKIKCGVTFSDLDSWGISKALCIEETCKGKGNVIYGGPT